MSIPFDSESYLILTNTVPVESCKVDDEHTIQAVKTSKAMFNGFSLGIPHGYCAIIAFPALSRRSYEVYRDLIMFHSFACDDPETYDYSERILEKKYPNSELKTIRNKDYFYERILVSPPQAQNRKYIKRKRINAIKFNQFPLVVYPTDREILNDEPSQEEIESMKSGVTLEKDIVPEFENIVNYSKAFQTFCRLKESDGKIYGAICLYVFSRNLREFNEIYDNDYSAIALYIAILETLAGRPPKCSNRPHCDICNKELEHDNPSLEKYFIQQYGPSFGKLRKIRHAFFHGAKYYSLADAMYDLYDRNQNRHKLSKEDASEEHQLWNLRDETDRLEKVARLNLLKSFLAHYG